MDSAEIPEDPGWAHEQRGDFAGAARAYLHEGLDQLLDAEFRIGDWYRRGVADFYSAISCSIRAEKPQQARRIFSIAEPLLQHQISEADSTVEFVAAEWIGDGYLMLKDAEATYWYEHAKSGYDDLSFWDKTWTMEPEAALISGALRWAVEHYGAVPPIDGVEDPDMDYLARIDYKLELIEQLCPSSR